MTQPPAYRWAILAAAVVGFFQAHLHRMAFAPLIPTFVSDLGLSYAAAGAIQTAYFWTYTVVQVPIGVIADRWGTRRVMLTSMAVLVVGAVAFALAGTFGQSIAARMVVGLGAAAVWVPAMRLLSEWFPSAERARATGMISAGGGIGGTAGLLVVPALAAAWGWRWAYASTTVTAVLAFALIAAVVRPGPRAAAATAGAGRLGVVLRTRAVWPYNASVFFSYGAYFSFLTFLPAFLVRVLGATQPQAGLITGLVTAGTIVSWPLAGVFSDRIGRRKPIYLVSQVAAVGVCLFFATVSPGLGLVAAGAAALVTGLMVGGLIMPFVGVVELVPPALAATAAGVTNASCFVGGMVVPILLGRLIDVTGGFTGAFLVAAALQAAALVPGAFMQETGARRRPPAP